jgi:hypothetical protein
MSQQEKRGIYVYQPFGMQHPDKWKSGRIYGIGGLPMEATCHGFTKAEAEAIHDALIVYHADQIVGGGAGGSAQSAALKD